MIAARIDTASAILRSLESRQYKVGEARWPAVRDANELLAAQFWNTPSGVMGLTTKFLVHPEATYLVINLCEGHWLLPAWPGFAEPCRLHLYRR
jgi:hypothetical protein